LRLDYRDQPLGEALNIAMEPVATYSGNPTILSLVNLGSGLALIGGDGRSEFIAAPGASLGVRAAGQGTFASCARSSVCSAELSVLAEGLAGGIANMGARWQINK
jgi:hypothetical protein